MIYTYDILLNLSTHLYNFYEWERKDNIEHIKKIPLIRVNSKTINDIYENKIKVDQTFLKKIENLCERFDFKKKKYACLFADLKHVIAVEFNDKGESILKSRIIIDDEEEILNYIYKVDEEKIEYKIMYNDLEISFLTRREQKIKDYLLKEIDRAYLKKDLNKIKYLYLEYFDIDSDDIKEMYNNLRSNISKNNSEKNNKLYEVLLLETGRNKV